MRLPSFKIIVIVVGFFCPLSTAFSEGNRFQNTMTHNPHCDQLAQQFNEITTRRVPPEYGRHLSNLMTLVFSSKLPETACHDADVYWELTSETHAIQRRIIQECDGIWRDPETGKVILSRSNIEESYGEDTRRFLEDRQKICKTGSSAAPAVQ
jgi:hypothetical protein